MIFFLVLTINDFKSYNNSNKIIVAIFAGRKRYLEILMKFLLKLKDNKIIDEIHFWQFTNNKNDTDYLNSISNVHRTSSKFFDYRTIIPLVENNTLYIYIKSSNGGGEILINNKYDLKVNIGNYVDNYLVLNITNSCYYKKLEYNYIEYVLILKIINNKLIIFEKNKILFSKIIDDKKFNLIQIRSLNNSDAFWEYKESFNKGIKLFDTTFRGASHWYEMYKFYLQYDFKILIKMDDDICFIDINRFDKFINYISLFKKNVIIPNLVNHAVSLYYNNKYELIPNNILNKKYLNRISSRNIFDYYKDGKQAQKIHIFFLKNIKNFTN